MTRQELELIVKENIGKYTHIAIRGTDEPHQIGEILETSYDWDMENDISTLYTDDPVELGGVCCIDMTNDYYRFNWAETEKEINEMLDEMINRIEFAVKGYSYPHYSIVVSNDRNPLGYDENDKYEIILADAKVVEVFEK